MADLFASYKSEDRARVRPLVNALEADGLSVWWDAHIGAGAGWRQTIQTELGAAKCVLVAWSKRSVGPEGEFVHDEASRARKRGVYLPVLLDPVEPPLGFGETQALSLVGWRGARDDPRYQAVLAAARAVVAGKPMAPLPVAASRPGLDRRALIAAGVALAGLGAWRLWPRAAAPSHAEDPAIVNLVERGMDGFGQHDAARQEQALALLREAVLRAPDSAMANGALALGYARMLFRIPHSEQPEWLRRSKALAARSLSLDPEEPHALTARAVAMPLFGNWAEADAIQLSAMAVSERIGEPASFRSRFMVSTGQLTKAVEIADAALARDPAALYEHYRRGLALWGLGREDEADKATADMLRLFPGNYLAWFSRFYFLLYSSRLKEAEAMIDDRAGWPGAFPAAEIANTRAMVRAMESPGGSAADQLMNDYRGMARTGRGHMENGARLAAGLGRHDEALAFMETYFLSPLGELPDVRFPDQRNFGHFADRLTDLLFVPPVTQMHEDPRFLALLERIGMADFWRKAGITPDFCGSLTSQKCPVP